MGDDGTEGQLEEEVEEVEQEVEVETGERETGASATTLIRTMIMIDTVVVVEGTAEEEEALDFPCATTTLTMIKWSGNCALKWTEKSKVTFWN